MNKPESIRLGAMYIRESTEEQDNGFSPAKQEKDIRAYATKNGIKIVESYKDLKSGRSAEKRQDFMRMINDAKEKKFDIILVFHTSRFSRDRLEAGMYKKQLRKIGVDFQSVSQPIGDPDDLQGYSQEVFNEIFDEMYSKQLSFWMKKALTQKRESGYAPGNPPLGYRKKKGNTREWFIDPAETKLVKAIFQKYSTGKYSMVDVSQILNKDNNRTKQGNVFTLSAIKTIISNRAYLGYVSSPRKGYPEIKGLHKAIISQALFEKAQKVATERTHSYGRPTAKHRSFLLQGLVYCQHCVRRMRGKDEDVSNIHVPKMYCWASTNGKGAEYYYYSCKFRKENRSCKQMAVRCEIIDKQVLKYMENLKLPDSIIKRTLENLDKLFNQYTEVSDDSIEIERLEARKRKLNTMFLETETISLEKYKSQIQEITDRLKDLTNKGVPLAPFKSNQKQALIFTEAYLRDFRNFWNSNLSDKDRQDWIRMTIKRIWVKDKKVVAIEPRDEFKALFSSLKVFGQGPLAAPLKKES
jgi:site-specific DNA recombinase